SDDAEMKRPFIEGADFHWNTARDVFGDDLRMLSKAAEEKDANFFEKYLERPMMLEIRANGIELLESGEFEKLKDYIADYLRFLTKFITFGIMYGRGAKSLAEGELNCRVVEAEQYIQNFYKKYPGFY